MTKSRVASLLEKISKIVPGVAGYQDRERRRDADTAVRNKIVASLTRCRHRLSNGMSDISRAGGRGSLSAVGNLERVNTRLERIEDEIRYAPHGYAGWFDREGVALEDLERLYEHDLSLLEIAERMVELVGPVEALGSERDWMQDLGRELEALRQALDNRMSVIRGGEEPR